MKANSKGLSEVRPEFRSAGGYIPEAAKRRARGAIPCLAYVPGSLNLIQLISFGQVQTVQNQFQGASNYQNSQDHQNADLDYSAPEHKPLNHDRVYMI